MHDLHLLVEGGIVGGDQLEAELVDALGEAEPVLAFARRDREEQRAHVGIRSDVGPGREVRMTPALGVGDRIEQSEVAGLLRHITFPRSRELGERYRRVLAGAIPCGFAPVEPAC